MENKTILMIVIGIIILLLLLLFIYLIYYFITRNADQPKTITVKQETISSPIGREAQQTVQEPQEPQEVKEAVPSPVNTDEQEAFCAGVTSKANRQFNVYKTTYFPNAQYPNLDTVSTIAPKTMYDANTDSCIFEVIPWLRTPGTTTNNPGSSRRFTVPMSEVRAWP